MTLSKLLELPYPRMSPKILATWKYCRPSDSGPWVTFFKRRKRSRKDKKIQGNLRKNPSPKNGIRVEEIESYQEKKTLQWHYKCPKEDFFKKRSSKKKQEERLDQLEGEQGLQKAWKTLLFLGLFSLLKLGSLQ